MSDRDLAISVRGLSKSYTIAHNAPKHTTMAEAFVHTFKKNGRAKPEAETFWALKDIEFDVKKGDVVGIIGRNGAGKSTLLKILSRITEPTTGQIDVYGRIGSLLEVGTGFHPELTGRENIYMNGSILGMSRREIAKHFDDIVQFAEVEQFLDTPVKRYSSGMYVRLAFAVAAHLNPEILIVDEVLAVGDATFQKKCLGKMQDVSQQEGRTIIFVSHNMAAMSNLCSRAVLVDAGQILKQGATQSIIDYYLSHILAHSHDEIPLSERTDRTGSGRLKLTNFHIETPSGKRISTVSSGKDIVLVFGYQVMQGGPPRNIDIGLSVKTLDGQMLFVLYSSYNGRLFDTDLDSGTFRCTINKLPLAPGTYRIGARVTVNGIDADWVRNDVAQLHVELGDFYGSGSSGFADGSHFFVDGEWSADEERVYV